MSDTIECDLGEDPDALLTYATKTSKLKDAIHQKANNFINIDEAQEKDKVYYDRKHADTRVN